jgi:hypothetical protein
MAGEGGLKKTCMSDVVWKLPTVATGKGRTVKIYQSFNEMATHEPFSTNINILWQRFNNPTLKLNFKAR